MGVLLGLNLLLALFGYLLPVPTVFLAWREWLRIKQEPPAKAWQRAVSHSGVLLLSLGVALWAYAIVRDARFHEYSDIVISAIVGRWGSLGLVVVCAFAEQKLRRYLLLGAVGLLFFFGVSVGDVVI